MDRWIFLPALASLVLVAILTFVCGLPGSVSFLMIPISLLGYTITTITLLMTAVIFVAKKRQRRAASLLIALIAPMVLWSPINWAAECAHLGLTVGFGAGQLGSASKPGDRGLAAYDWSIGLAGGPNTFLIHDETDEIALPMARHKQPSSYENGFGEECAGKVHHLLDHYYVCTF